MKHFPTLRSDEAKDVKFFIYGHTHRYKLEEEDGIIYICPGSVSLPRDGTLGTYIIINISEEEAVIEVYELGSKKHSIFVKSIVI